MKVFQNLIVFIFWVFICYAPQAKFDQPGPYDPSDSKAAVIISGNQFHHEGLAIEASLLQKGYDVQLVQSQLEQYWESEDWSKTPVVKNLKEHYERLLFIVTGHGNHDVGVGVRWDSLLKLIQILEAKADEVWVHVDTCHSGDIVDKWMANFGKKVKIFTTASCAHKLSSFIGSNPNHTNPMQIFTGNYMFFDTQQPGLPYDCPKFKTDSKYFLKLTCNASVDDVLGLMDRDCGETCYKTHVHHGKDEKIRNWNLLPNNLYEQVGKKHFKFQDTSCKFKPVPFDKKESATFDKSINISKEVNTFDPIDQWKVRTVDIIFGGPNAFFVKEELKTKNIPSYSTILSINDSECDIESEKCTHSTGEEILTKSTKLSFAYHKNKNEIYTLMKEVEEDHFWIIMLVVACVIGVLAAICITFYMCGWSCGRQKRRRAAVPHQNTRNITISRNYNNSGNTRAPTQTTVQQYPYTAQNYTGYSGYGNNRSLRS